MSVDPVFRILAGPVASSLFSAVRNMSIPATPLPSSHEATSLFQWRLLRYARGCVPSVFRQVTSGTCYDAQAIFIEGNISGA